ncbi:MAG: NUDIX hydrolase [Alistipes sp.]
MEKPQNRQWKVVCSEYLARKPWFTVRHECVELPNGNRVPDYYVFEYPDWVNVIAITKEHQFVFITQYRHGLGETAYEIVAGVIEPADTSPLAAAKRELLEEAGYGNGVWREQMVLCANPATQNNLTHCFVATDVERLSAQQLDNTEDIKVCLLTIDQVRELLETSAIKQALMAAPLWKYMAEK